MLRRPRPRPRGLAPLRSSSLRSAAKPAPPSATNQYKNLTEHDITKLIYKRIFFDKITVVLK